MIRRLLKLWLHWGFRLAPRAVGPLLVLLPLVWLAVQGFNALLRQADGLLAQATPVITAELSTYLRRPVQIGKLTPNLTVRKVYDIFLHPDTYGTIPIEVTEIVVGNRSGNRPGDLPADLPLTDAPNLATVRQITLFVSLPSALSGDFSNAVKRIQVESPELLVVRDTKGGFNLLDIVREIISRQKKPAKPQPAFKTVVEITNARLHLRDYDSGFADRKLPATKRPPAINDIVAINTTVDLSGTRLIHLETTAQALPGSVTAPRLGGKLTVSGNIRRDDPGKNPDGPNAGTPILALQVAARDADLHYWIHYIIQKVPVITVEKGRGDADISVLLPDQTKADPKPISLNLRAAFRDTSAGLSFLNRVPLTKSNGTLDFADGLLQFKLETEALGERVAAQGTLWDLPEIGVAPKTTVLPSYSVSLNAPQLPLKDAVMALLPEGQRLPPELTVGGIVGVTATLNGTAYDNADRMLNALSIVGHISGANGAWRGLPGAENIASDFTLSGGVLQLSRTTATLRGGGSVSGEGTVQVFGAKKEIGNTVFSARADGVDLSRLSLLAEINKGDVRTRLHGLGGVVAVGKRIEGKLTAVANIDTHNLAVGSVPIPVARARVLIDDNRVVVPALRLESPAGIASVTGNIDNGNRLNLRFAVASLDLQTIGRVVGFKDGGGTVNTFGTITGTVKEPLLHIADLIGTNLRLKIPPDRSTKGKPVTRQFALDLVRGQNIELSRARLHLTDPLLVFRFPARIAATGDITNLLPTTPKAPFNPTFNLQARVENLSYEEVMRQLEGATSTAANGFSGSLVAATVNMKGTLTSPNITGQAKLSSLLIGSYPLVGGALTFDYNKQRLQVANARIRIQSESNSTQGKDLTTGVLIANAVLTPKGKLSGSFIAPRLTLEKFSYLTNGVLRFEGEASVTGEISGDLKKPIVGAKINSTGITVSGIRYTDLDIEAIRFVGGDNNRGGIIDMPSLTFRRRHENELSPDDTIVRLSGTHYNLTTGDVASNLTIKNGDITTLLELVRRSGLDETEKGAGVVRAIANLPTRTLAVFDINQFAVRGKIDKGTLVNSQVDANIEAHDLSFGQFEASNMHLTGTLRDKVVKVAQFDMKTNDATIRGEGTYDPDGNIDAYLESNAASLNLVRSFPGQDGFPLYGAVDFSITAKGSSKNPQVTASVQGNNLFYAVGNGQSILGRKRNLGNIDQYGVDISLLRVEADLTQSNPGQYSISISDALLKAGNMEVLADALIPITTDEKQGSIAQRPLRFRVRTNTIDLKDLLAFLQGKETTTIADNSKKPKKSSRQSILSFLQFWKKRENTPSDMTDADVGGKLTANISYDGTLANPLLSGNITIADAHARLARTGKTDRVSPITDFNANLRLAGSSILFDEFDLKLGTTNGQKGDGGSLNIAGGIKLQSLSDLETMLRGTETVKRNRPRVQPSLGSYDLKMTFAKFRPAIDNLLGLGEAAKAQVDGTILMTNDLLLPTIATPTDLPLTITKAEIRTPSVQKEITPPTTPPSFNPYLNIAIALPDKNIITSSDFRFEARGFGNTTVKGHLFPQQTANPGNNQADNKSNSSKPAADAGDLEVAGALTTEGGYFQKYPIPRFTVKRGGAITLRYNSSNPGIYVNNVTATTKISTKRGLSLRTSSSQDVLTSNNDTTTPVDRYDITVTLNGQLDILNDGTNPNSSNTSLLNMSFTADPYLSSSEILALIGGKAALDQAKEGQVEAALQNFANQALYSSVLPGVLSQVTGGVAQTLGLEDLTVSYNPDGSIPISIKRRLPDPFNRFIVDYSRTFQQRQTLNQLTPFTFSFSYELYQFKSSYRVLPRIQIGFKTDELRNNTFFLNGVVNY